MLNVINSSFNEVITDGTKVLYSYARIIIILRFLQMKTYKKR